MNASTQLDYPKVHMAETESDNQAKVLISHRFLRTQPTKEFLCRSETRPSDVITWEPVLLPLLERLAELRSTPYEQRWHNADWPNEEAFLNAGRFTEQLPLPLKMVPHISLADDGEVNFSWSHDGMRIDLGFYGTGTFSFYARDKTGKEWLGDDISVTLPIPVELRVLLAK
jgi:hypothetical protein